MLNNLEIKNGSISPEFDSNITNYEVHVSDAAICLVMEFETDEENEIVVYGNDFLLEGENHVLIDVFDGKNVQTYNLTVYKGTESVISNETISSKLSIYLTFSLPFSLIRLTKSSS